MVNLGFEVTKIQKYYVIFVYIFQGKTGKTGKTEIQLKENPATKVTKKTEIKLPKYVMSRAIVKILKKRILEPWFEKG